MDLVSRQYSEKLSYWSKKIKIEKALHVWGVLCFKVLISLNMAKCEL